MEPLFKVGEKVRVKKLSYSKSECYKYGLNEKMCALSGSEVTIEEVKKNYSDAKKEIPDDNALYKLVGISWSWASSMLEKISTSSVTVGSRKGVKLNFKV